MATKQTTTTKTPAVSAAKPADTAPAVPEEKPVPKRNPMKDLATAWPEEGNAVRLRNSVNYLHTFGLLSDDEAVKLKERINEADQA